MTTRLSFYLVSSEDNVHTRFSRQLSLLGEELQRKLRRLRVVVFGAGGLGTFLLINLAGLGVGHILVVDFDKVSLTDLNRQLVLYSIADIGTWKARTARAKLCERVPDVDVEAVVLKAEDVEHVRYLVRKADVVFDCLDNPDAKLIVNDACVLERRPLIHGGVRGFHGQVIRVEPGKTPCLRCLLTYIPRDRTRPVEVIAPTCSAVASLQAAELVNMLAGWLSAEENVLLLDLRRGLCTRLSLRPDCLCNLCLSLGRS